jgi:hypothetical protein
LVKISIFHSPSQFYNHRDYLIKAFECISETRTEAPIKFPIVTGSKLFKKNIDHVTGAPYELLNISIISV